MATNKQHRADHVPQINRDHCRRIELTTQSHGAVLVFLMRTLLASGRPETFLDQPPSERLP